jgi:hypothetical protein
MKNLRFEQLELISTLEKKARTIEFHPRLTILKGKNDVGKSSVIKSLYWAFGARPQMHPKWTKANVKAHVTFTIDEQRYSILRDGSKIALFDENGKVLVSTKSVTKTLGPFVAKLLNFGLVLPNREGNPETPPPAYAFLPFYIDQDNGWRQPLESFDIRGQYNNVRKHIIDFHSGIRPNEYYELQAQKRKFDMERGELMRDRATVTKAIRKLGLTPTFTGLELTENGHEEAIDRLLRSLQELRIFRQKRAAELAEIVDEWTILMEQLSITQAAVQELTKDFSWISKIEENELLCPTCGTIHSNNFANRFSILDDQDACLDFLQSGYDRLEDLSRKVAQVEADMKQSDDTMAKITETLAERQGEISLQDVIETEGRRNAAALFDAQIEELTAEINKRSSEMEKIDLALRDLKDGKRKKDIESFYAKNMLYFLRELDVTNIDYDSVSKIDRRINDTGSDQARAVLAYYLALMKTIYKFSTALTAPMVIDSPNQQDQDAKNVAAMIGLIFSSRPDNGQTILGTVSLHDQTVNEGKIITFTEKWSVLSTDGYDATRERLMPYLDQM